MGACASRATGSAVHPLKSAHVGTDDVSCDQPGAAASPPAFAASTLFRSEIRQSTAPTLMRMLHVGQLLFTRRGPAQEDNRRAKSATSAVSAGAALGSAPAVDSAIKVAVLVRPLLEHEQGEAEAVQVTGQPRQLRVWQAAGGTNTTSFAFDSVHSKGSDSEALFSAHGAQLVERFCSGFNACAMAYGQTGSGKTHSMGLDRPWSCPAPGTAAATREQAGLAARMARAVYKHVHAKEASGIYDVTVKVSLVEIVNEQVQDLLRCFTPALGGGRLVVPGGGSGRTDVREVGGRVTLEGAAMVEAPTLQALAEAVDWGISVRATGSHRLNEQSSRSHAILLLTLEQRVKPSAVRQVPRELHHLRSRLSIVDLAGSERVKQTGAEGARLAEGIHINQSLLTLGKVVNAVVEGQPHVPYRESKLTRVLQDSLGGTAETLLVACVSPAACHLEQTLNTLRWAQRAQGVRNHLKLQSGGLSLAEEVAHLRALVSRLEQENAVLSQRLVQQQQQQQARCGSPEREAPSVQQLKATWSVGGVPLGVPSVLPGSPVAQGSLPLGCRNDSARDPYEADLSEESSA